MRIAKATTLAMCCALWTALVTGCEPSDAGGSTPPENRVSDTIPAPPPGAAASAARRTETPAAPAMQPQPPAATPPPASGAQLDGSTLHLAGISMTVPEGWIAQPVPPGPMAAKAVFAIPHSGGSGEAGSVRITHYPGMKGNDEMNINRWLAQTTRPDGSPLPREDAHIEHEDLGGVQLTIVDVSGSVKATMRGTAQPGGRMIATIIDHPQGPHFVVATGPATTITAAEEAIRAFVHSVRTE